MSRKPSKPSDKNKSSNQLLDALNFLSVISKDEGTPYETHILLSNKTAVAYNDTLSAGVLTDIEVYAAPNTKMLLNGMSKCAEDYTLVIDGTKIVVKSGKFKASIPCIDPSLLSARLPDVPCAVIDDRLKEAFKAMDIIKAEPNAQRIHLLAFLLNGPSVITTDGRVLLEYWHGIDLPTLSIPKSVIAPILKNTKKLTQFGFSNNSATFFFEDNSWIKSQLYADEFPIGTIQNIMNRDSFPVELPKDFYNAISAVAPFSESGNIFFKRNLLCSHNTIEAGATHEVDGLPDGPKYNYRFMMMVKDYVEKIDFKVSIDDKGYMCFFFGKNIRGVIAGHG